MRYDVNEATHVKDLVGEYTITTDTGGAVPAAADPFGGNNAFNLDDVYIMYGGEKEISGLKATVAFWVKLSSNSTCNYLFDAQDSTSDFPSNNRRTITFVNGKPGISTTGMSDVENQSTQSIPLNSWHYIEINYDNSLVRIFIDGKLTYSGTNNRLTTYQMLKYKNCNTLIGQFFYYVNERRNKFKGCIYDFCILNGIWHTENYTVPTSYI